MKRFFVICALLCSYAPVLAAPPAKIADLAWMVGAWEGEGIGGAPAVEVYSAPADGKMVGHFRQLKPDGSVMFYELITIEEVDGSLSYNLKHFNADLTGWEEKGEALRFPLTATAGQSWNFSGITYTRTESGEMTATVVSKDKNGQEERLSFRFRRQ